MSKIYLKKVNPWFIALLASIATFIEVLDTTIVNVSLKHISGDLGAGEDEGTWLITSYLVANAIVIPLSGWLSELIGRKKFFIFCILGFTLSSFLCGAATSLTELIIFRIIQGAAGGGLQPVQQAIILDIFPAEKRGLVFAVTGITMIVAPILGPILGGFITDNSSWRWIFYINIPIGIISASLLWMFLEDVPNKTIEASKKIDFISISFLSLGLGALQIVLDKGQQEDWLDSNFIISWSTISFISLTITIIWLWGKKNSIIDLSIFRDKTYTISCILIFLIGFVLYGGSIILPVLLQSNFNYTSTLVGKIMSPAGIFLLFLMPIIGKLSNKIENRYFIYTGLLLVGFGMIYSSHINHQTDFETFRLMRIAQIIGLPFLFIPISILAFSNISAEKRNKASAIFSLSRNLGGGVGIAVMTTYITRQTQIHQSYLGEKLNISNIAYYLSLNKLENHTNETEIFIYNELLKESAILAYCDSFKLMGIIMLIAVIFAFIMLPKKQKDTKDSLPTH
jgi:DHA2 family multidrug resistance protein